MVRHFLLSVCALCEFTLVQQVHTLQMSINGKVVILIEMSPPLNAETRVWDV